MPILSRRSTPEYHLTFLLLNGIYGMLMLQMLKVTMKKAMSTAAGAVQTVKSTGEMTTTLPFSKPSTTAGWGPQYSLQETLSITHVYMC